MKSSDTSKASLETSSGDNSSGLDGSGPSGSSGQNSEKDKDVSKAVDKGLVLEGGQDQTDVMQVKYSHLLRYFGFSYRIFTVFCLLGGNYNILFLSQPWRSKFINLLESTLEVRINSSSLLDLGG